MKLGSAIFAGLASLAIAASPAAAARLSPEARLAKLLDGRVAGQPVNCISLATIRSSQVIDGQAIIYRTGASTFYVNRPRIGADALDDDSILVTRTPTSSLCSLDTVQLVDRASRIPRGFVGLGEFVPYRRAPTR
jgi:hypothetical protein